MVNRVKLFDQIEGVNDMRKFKLEAYDPPIGVEKRGVRLFDGDSGIPQYCPYSPDESPCGNWCPRFLLEYPKDKSGAIFSCGDEILGEVVK